MSDIDKSRPVTIIVGQQGDHIILEVDIGIPIETAGIFTESLFAEIGAIEGATWW